MKTSLVVSFILIIMFAIQCGVCEKAEEEENIFEEFSRLTTGKLGYISMNGDNCHPFLKGHDSSAFARCKFLTVSYEPKDDKTAILTVVCEVNNF